MRQACVQFECISNIDNPFNNVKPFIFKPVQKERVFVYVSLLLSMITSHDGNFQVGVVEEQVMITIMT
jgi:hypothetical protein